MGPEEFPAMLRLTLAQMLKLIVFCAVGLAVPMALTTPGVPGHSQATLVGVVSLMLVPLAWAVLTLGIVTPGPARDRLVVGLTLFALTTLMLGLGAMFVLIVRLRAQGQPVGTAGAPWILLAVVLSLLGAWVLLARIFWRRGPVDESRPGTPTGLSGGGVR